MPHILPTQPVILTALIGYVSDVLYLCEQVLDQFLLPKILLLVGTASAFSIQLVKLTALCESVYQALPLYEHVLHQLLLPKLLLPMGGASAYPSHHLSSQPAKLTALRGSV